MLGQEVQYLEELLGVVEEEKQVLLQGNHEGLIPLSERKAALSRSLADAQNKRLTLQKKLSSSPENPIGLADLEKHLEKSSQSAFRSTVRSMQAMAGRLKDLNQANGTFVQEALKTVEHLLGIITGSGEAQGYGPRPGGARKAHLPPRLVAKEV
jgi:flagellar biosynthesis/type III secretory pathway chaperone